MRIASHFAIYSGHLYGTPNDQRYEEIMLLVPKVIWLRAPYTYSPLRVDRQSVAVRY